jgi:hypothetical protein
MKKKVFTNILVIVKIIIQNKHNHCKVQYYYNITFTNSYPDIQFLKCNVMSTKKLYG